MSATAHAGGWTQPKDSAQLITSARYYSTDSYQDNSGKKRSQPSYSKYELNPYFEYGLSDWVTLGANLMGDVVTQDSPNRSQSSNLGLTDTELFSRIRIWQSADSVLSLQPLIKLPSYYRNSGQPRSGSSDWDAELALQGGTRFALWNESLFTTISAAYRARGGESNDQFRGEWLVGLNASRNWMWLAKSSYTGRLDAPANAVFTQSGGDDYNLLTIGLSGVYSLTDSWSLEAGAFSHVYTKNTGNGGGLMVSVWKQF